MQHLYYTQPRGLWWSSCILLMLLATMHSCNSSLAARSPGNETDRMALIDIKLHMNDPDDFLDSWNDSLHHCQWPGVSCSTRHQRVTALNLRGKSLSGTISSYVGNLSFMKVIYLGENGFHGGIPQQIGQLSRLRFLNLSNNLLSGEIPVNLTTCSLLIYMDLMRNSLTGQIPPELGSLKNLKSLALSVNSLTGKIPSSLGNLSSSLTRISLGFNNLEGYIPNELGSLTGLILLGLGPNKLTGQIPPSLFNISELTIFSVTDNILSGKIPVNLNLNLPNLEYLEIGGNQFSGEIPVSITYCTNLIRLDLSGNKFEGNFPLSVGKLLDLERLHLENNSLQGNVMDFIAPLTNCTNLITLYVGENNLSGELSSIIGNLSIHLTRLHLAYNQISGIIPGELGNLVRLGGLFLGDNSLTGAIPTNLGRLQNLEKLDLNRNRLSGEIPPELCSNMTKLYALNISDNILGGDLSNLGQCQRLQWLWISENQFSGSIPSQMFGSYISLIQLDLSNNSLSGTIPLQVEHFANLQRLDVSHNRLSGPIPSTFGGCLVIESLSMSSNQFNGSLPPSLADLKGIKLLDLSNNTLTGPIPGGLSQLLVLNHLNLSYNDLEGEVPSDGVFSNASQIMLQGNTKLCGGISELKLPACRPVHINALSLKSKLILALSALAISTILSLYLFLLKKRFRFPTRMPSVFRRKSGKELRVSYHDLYRATTEFSPANLIGSGKFGFVYKGKLYKRGEIKVVAVKVLDLRKRGASRSFKAECMALSNLRHRNLLPLLTYCSSIDYKGDDFKALVYKYMLNGSLDTWLHLDDHPLEPPRTCLSLLQRINIAIDVALALDHLHNHSHTPIAHCDIKPSNILLDDELTAYVGDFGLVRLFPQLQQGANSNSTIAIKGSIGYVPPEYAMGLEVSTRGDAYSYGILLLEMFTGRRPTNDAFVEGLDLHNFVKKGLPDQVWRIVDPSILSTEAQQHSQDQAAPEDGNTQECLVSVLKVGLGCSQAAAKHRMDMKQVTRELHFIRDALCVR